MEPGYPRYNLFSASSIASQNSNPGYRSGPGFKTGMSMRGPPSVAESIAKEDCLSKDTKMLFKSMMGASKLSSFQQRMLDQLVSSGSSLPSKPTPGMAPRPNSASSNYSSASASTFSQADINAHHRLQKKRLMMSEITNPRPSLRPLATIMETDAFEQEKYRPTMKKNREVEKKKLQRFMETDGGKNVIPVDQEWDEDEDCGGGGVIGYGCGNTRDGADSDSGLPDVSGLDVGGDKGSSKESLMKAGSDAHKIGFGRRKGGKGGIRGTVAKAAEGNGVHEIDEFDMGARLREYWKMFILTSITVFREIEERKQWLDDMVALGRGEVYRKQIQNEIAVRIKRLEQIDREKASKN
ncbi:UNVERIFIED_CONTAM: hypothetical protein HDU68_010176 [Siphonaria sp. JEL0065]|nr:hypothetical protein HDU68_010176 [Siphonaria sp. JEL0065]